MLTSNVLSLRKRPLLFKRWSRKRYAQFVSLHREVVIGVIKASICYASMLKMKILMTDACCPEIISRQGGHDDDDGSGGVCGEGLVATSVALIAQQRRSSCAIPARAGAVAASRGRKAFFNDIITEVDCRLLRWSASVFFPPIQVQMHISV